LLVPDIVPAVIWRGPGIAASEIESVAVAVVALVTTTPCVVTPPPSTETVIGDTKPAPFSSTMTVAPGFETYGELPVSITG
jgi:hypothetical protein